MLQQYTREFRYNFRLASPVILGMLGHTFVVFADNIMVGQLGTAELAAVSLGNSFVFIAMSLGIGFSTAITPLVAEADGRGDRGEGRQVLQHGLVLCSLLGLVLDGGGGKLGHSCGHIGVLGHGIPGRSGEAGQGQIHGVEGVGATIQVLVAAAQAQH